MASILDASNPAGHIEPFWQRIHRFFTLPLERVVLMRIGALAAATVLALSLFFLGVPGALLGLIALFAVLVVGARYGFKIIERSSRGFLQPAGYPVADDDLVSRYLPYKFVAMNAVFGLVFGLVVALTRGSEFFSLLVWFTLFVVVIPAATMRLVITGSIRNALNPAELVALIQRIGAPYAALAAFVFFADLCRTYGMAALAVAGGLGAGVVGIAGGTKAAVGFGGIALLFLMSAGFWYFTYVICALIGYAMYQYADKLDIAVTGPGEEGEEVTALRTGEDKGRTRDALIGQAIAAGEIKEAIALLQEDLRDRPSDLPLHARLHRLLAVEGNPAAVTSHADRYMALLVKSQNWPEAIELYEDTVARHPEWMPAEGGYIVSLAQAALRAGKAKVAAGLVRAFDKRYPGHPDIPSAYLLGARIMAEYGNKPADAQRILKYLVKRHAGNPAAAEASRYLDVMARMAR